MSAIFAFTVRPWDEFYRSRLRPSLSGSPVTMATGGASEHHEDDLRPTRPAPEACGWRDVQPSDWNMTAPWRDVDARAADEHGGGSRGPADWKDAIMS